MQIPIFIEGNKELGFHSIGGEPYALQADGASEAEVLRKLQAQLRERLARGAKLLSLDLSDQATENPWLLHSGMFAGDPHFEEWQKSIAENRAKSEADDSIP